MSSSAAAFQDLTTFYTDFPDIPWRDYLRLNIQCRSCISNRLEWQQSRYTLNLEVFHDVVSQYLVKLRIRDLVSFWTTLKCGVASWPQLVVPEQRSFDRNECGRASILLAQKQGAMQACADIFRCCDHGNSAAAAKTGQYRFKPCKYAGNVTRGSAVDR